MTEHPASRAVDPSFYDDTLIVPEDRKAVGEFRRKLFAVIADWIGVLTQVSESRRTNAGVTRRPVTEGS